MTSKDMKRPCNRCGVIYIPIGRHNKFCIDCINEAKERACVKATIKTRRRHGYRISKEEEKNLLDKLKTSERGMSE